MGTFLAEWVKGRGQGSKPASQLELRRPGLGRVVRIDVNVFDGQVGGPEDAAAIALMQGGASSRTLALIASFLGLISGPLGIALGVYTMIVMVPRSVGQTRADFVSAA